MFSIPFCSKLSPPFDVRGCAATSASYRACTTSALYKGVNSSWTLQKIKKNPTLIEGV